MEFQRYFTPEEAKKTLPLVKSIVEDLLATGQSIRRYVQNQQEINYDHPNLEPLLNKLDGYHSELLELGCFFKDWNYEIGLVDFPAIIDDKPVFLCWRSDEDELIYFHGIHEGYSGRKKILTKYFD